jgi:histidinol-phosphate/aromatic aminotransferase/cobyric acid decarboxylase-like protein
VVVDESFIEFTGVNREDIPTLRSYLTEFPELIVMRSLGKDFGACGLRLGLMATSNSGVLDEIRRFLPIWNISPLAEKFLRLCVEYRDDYEQARVRCIKETQALEKELASISKLKVYSTFSNFILFKILDARVSSVELRDHLLKKFGFYVRDCSRKAGLGDKFIRVGTNLPKDNARLVEAIAQYLK